MTGCSPVHRLFRLLLVFLLPLLFAACSIGKTGNSPATNDSTSNAPVFGFSMDSEEDEGTAASMIVRQKVGNIANGIISSLKARKTEPKNFRCIMASFVNLDDMSESSQLGRLLSEELITALSNRGFNVIEVRVGKDLIIEKEKGEFLLSRKVKELTNRYSANSFIIGTYSVFRGRTVFINTRLVRAADMEVYAASRDSISLQQHPYLKRVIRDTSFEKGNARWHGVEDK